MLSITFVSNVAIARLNAKHLGHRGATDVISFGFAGAGKGSPVVGDMYIAPVVARANALRTGAPIREELARLVVHGTLARARLRSSRGHAHEVADVEAAGTPALSGAQIGMIIAWIVAVLALAVGCVWLRSRMARCSLPRDTQSREGSTLPRGDARERTHRALSITRLFAQLTSGAAFAIGSELWMRPHRRSRARSRSVA